MCPCSKLLERQGNNLPPRFLNQKFFTEISSYLVLQETNFDPHEEYVYIGSAHPIVHLALVNPTRSQPPVSGRSASHCQRQSLSTSNVAAADNVRNLYSLLACFRITSIVPFSCPKSGSAPIDDDARDWPSQPLVKQIYSLICSVHLQSRQAYSVTRAWHVLRT